MRDDKSLHAIATRPTAADSVRRRALTGVAWGTLLPLGLMCASLTTSTAHAQSTTATLNGTATDSTGALIPDAEAVLKNEKTGSVRTTKSNSAGFFVFAAVPTGDYDVTVTHAGFEASSVRGIHLDPEDNKTLSQVKLQVGEVSQVVTVNIDDVGLTNSGEKSTLITAAQISKLSVEGRDVGELVKTLPGFAIAQTTPGSLDNAAYDPSQVNVTGALRSYAANGNAANGVSLMSDGSNITDPGDYGDSVQNVNMDMVEEVKVQTSNFTAETSNGPIVVNAVGKSGGQDYHGGLYVYARTGALNSEDALAKFEGDQKPNDHYIYPGGNLGGPVKIPDTNFNKSKKLTFFVGAEDYAQRNIYAYGSASTAIIHALVPTANMRTGDFSCSELLAYLGPAISCNANGTSTILNSRYVNVGSVPVRDRNDNNTGTGQITTIDPQSQALFNVLPLPNRTNLGDGYNEVQTNLENNDLYQTRLRLDEAFSDKVKLFGTYNVERGSSGSPEVPYYSPAAGGAGSGGVDTPGGGILSTLNSQTAGVNLTIIPTASFTNELLLNLTYFTQAFLPRNQTALLGSTIGYSYQGVVNSGTKQYPQFKDYGVDGLPLGLFPDFTVAVPKAKKTLPSLGDNVTYVFKTHTIKAGGYVQRVSNNQVLLPANSSTNGQISDYYYDPTSFTDLDGSTVYTSGNYAANFLEGEIEQFSQQNIDPPQNLYFWNINWYATDSWKITKRLSIDYGMRFEHLGPWQDEAGVGLAVYDLAKFPNIVAGLPGLAYHSVDSSVPVSGSPSRFAFYEPRFGMSYDVYGNGQTIFRGGWGEYRTHDDWNVVQPAAALAQGVSVNCVCSGAGVTLANLHLATTSTNGPPLAVGPASTLTYALDPNDSEQPLTYTYSATVSQQGPKKSVVEIGYVGNHGEYLTAQNLISSPISVQNANPVPLGAFFHPDPVTGSVTPLPLIDSLTSGQINDFRPNTGLGDVFVPKHTLYSYYNGLQTTWVKQSGKLNYAVSYTWSKVLGIKDGYYNGYAVDATNLRNNYAPLSFDRTHVVNTSYSYDFGKLYHGNRLLQGAANGWAVSGVTVLQSGPNLQSANYANFTLQGKLGAPTDTTQLNVDNKTFLGTPNVQLQPLLTCDPSVHRLARQFINANCFQLPQIGENGPFNFPYLRGPAYFDTDLTLAKNFGLGETRNLQFRLAAFNFLNHPLTTLTTTFPQQIQLNLSNLAVGGATQNPALATPAPNFGVSTANEGRRVVELAAKYSF